MSSTTTYDRLSQILHWLIAAAIMFLIVYHPSTESGHLTPTAFEINLHTSIGFILMWVVVARFVWKTTAAQIPEAPERSSATQLRIRHVVYVAFYVFMLAAPLVGMVLSFGSELDIRLFGNFQFPQLYDASSIYTVLRSLHGLSADILMLLTGIHMGAALYHHFILKDNLIRRMYGS